MLIRERCATHAAASEPETRTPLQAGAASSGGAASGRAEAARRRAFVVQFSPGCEAGDGEMSGRVQNLATADGGNFDTADGLIAILRQILASLERSRTETD